MPYLPLGRALAMTSSHIPCTCSPNLIPHPSRSQVSVHAWPLRTNANDNEYLLQRHPVPRTLYRAAARVQVKTTLNVPRTIAYIDKRCLGRAFVTVSSFIFFSHHSCSKCFCVLMIFFLLHRRLSVRRVFPAHPSSFPNPIRQIRSRAVP